MLAQEWTRPHGQRGLLCGRADVGTGQISERTTGQRDGQSKNRRLHCMYPQPIFYLVHPVIIKQPEQSKVIAVEKNYESQCPSTLIVYFNRLKHKNGDGERRQ